VVISLLSLAGAVSFALQFRAWRRGVGQVLRDGEFQALIAAIIVVALGLWLTLTVSGAIAGDWSSRLGSAAFLAVSAQTTAGFANVEIATLDPASKLVLIVSMVVGGDAGSTAGGIKIVRLLIILRLVHLAIARTCLPRQAVLEARVAGRPLEMQEVSGVLAFIALYAATIALSWLVFLLHGFAPLDSLFEVVSALGTVGLSSGVTAADLPMSLKLVLGLDMLLGRLEILALLVLVYPRTWWGRKGAS
jgi:trk system potassium uptake protein TrkH